MSRPVSTDDTASTANPAEPGTGPEPGGLDRRDRGDALVARIRSQPMTVVALGYLVLLSLLAVAAPLASPYDPYATDFRAILDPPSAVHWLGTDDLGRDMLSRLLYASRSSLLACLQAVGLGLLGGVLLGVTAGYFGGWVDRLVMTLIDAVLSVPGLLLAMSIVGVLGPGLRNAMFALAVIFVPIFARLSRIQALAVREETYLEAARSIGVSHLRSVLRHVLPNIAGPLVVQVFITMAVAIVAEGAMSYLGLSIQPPEASWGNLLQRAFSSVASAPWLIFIPGLTITLTVVAFQVLGDGLSQALSGGHQQKAGNR
ncbi:ABC transporter permease [Micromonospora sp. LOL_027]|uniref:ABC transporter permease n=1 Tax=Micromonospora sp. LOL_027 TaxID=3345419 RepID=UPI003A8589BF